MSFSLNGIPMRYRHRRDSEPKSWYAKRDRPFYGGVPRMRPKFYKRRRFLALLVFLFVGFYLLAPFGRRKAGSRGGGGGTADDAGDTDGPELDDVPTAEIDFCRKLRKPSLNGYTTLSDSTKQSKIRDVFQASWKAYKMHAWGKDEFYPVSQSGRYMVNKGMGWIIVDALDTLHIMGLQTELAEAKQWVAHDLSYDIDHDVNVFETTIRMLGGLLSAFHLTKDKTYLNQATDLGNRLSKAYQTSTGIPTASVNLHTGQPIVSHDDGGASSTAEATTLQLEMRYLSHLTGDPSYGELADKAMQRVVHNEKVGGLVPIFVMSSTGDWYGNNIRLGSRGDSYYEYLAKQWLMFDDERYHKEWEKSLDGVKRYLVRKTEPNGLTFIGELPDGVDGTFSGKMDHLVCFYPGTVALAATRGLSLQRAKQQAWWTRRQEEDMELAAELTRTCFETYNATRSGLAPEIVHFREHFRKGDHADRGTLLPDIEIHVADKHNIMRPETVESLFVMWRLTREEKYRQWAWQIFIAMEHWFAVSEAGAKGYTSLADITIVPPPKRDNMESFWLAETLKYLYLTFASERAEAGMGLDEIVFNTEAHPLPVIAQEAKLNAAQQPAWRKMQGKVETQLEEQAAEENKAQQQQQQRSSGAQKVMDPDRRKHIDDLKTQQIRRKALEARAKALGEGKNGKQANEIQKAVMDALQETLSDEQVLKDAGES